MRRQLRFDNRQPLQSLRMVVHHCNLGPPTIRVLMTKIDPRAVGVRTRTRMPYPVTLERRVFVIAQRRPEKAAANLAHAMAAIEPRRVR